MSRFCACLAHPPVVPSGVIIKSEEVISLNQYTMDYIVDYRDVDRYFDIKAESLMQMLGTVATHHEVLGFHLKPGYMMEWGMAWILYQWKIEVIRPKQYARKLRVQTLPVLKKDMYCYRYYLIRDTEGELVARAVSQWVAVDVEKRRIGRIPQPVAEIIEGDGILDEAIQRQIDEVDVAPLRKKIQTPDFELTIPILYSDIDSNLHVNNAIYGRWATETINAMDPAWLETRYHRAINVVYKKEKPPGGSVLSRLALDGDRTYHEIWDEAGNLLTLIEMTWVEKDRQLGDYSNYDFAAVMS